MARRNMKLIVGYGLAIAVCGVVALLDNVLIGLIGAGLSTVIFALTFLFPGSKERDEPEELLERRTTGPWSEEDVLHRDPGLPNPENVAVPVYYQIERRD